MEEVKQRKHKVHHRVNYSDRIFIEKQLQKKIPIVKIAKDIGVSRHTIYNELKRGTIDGKYDAEYAQKNLYMTNESEGIEDCTRAVYR